MLEEQLLEHLERAVEAQLVATAHPVPFEVRLMQRLDGGPGDGHRVSSRQRRASVPLGANHDARRARGIRGVVCMRSRALRCTGLASRCAIALPRRRTLSRRCHRSARLREASRLPSPVLRRSTPAWRQPISCREIEASGVRRALAARFPVHLRSPPPSDPWAPRAAGPAPASPPKHGFGCHAPCPCRVSGAVGGRRRRLPRRSPTVPRTTGEGTVGSRLRKGASQMNTEARSSIDNLLTTLKESLAQPGKSLLAAARPR